MKRLKWVLVTGFGVATLAACGGGEVIVQAETENIETGEAIALSSLVVQLLPFNRDQVFDSLARAYPEPEPPIPDTIIKLQEAVRVRRTSGGRSRLDGSPRVTAS